jgi:hypothetical protein
VSKEKVNSVRVTACPVVSRVSWTAHVYLPAASGDAAGLTASPSFSGGTVADWSPRAGREWPHSLVISLARPEMAWKGFARPVQPHKTQHGAVA